MAIYMLYGTVKGEVSESAHAKWVELSSFQFGIGRGITTAIGRGTSREAGLPSISEIVVTKPMDASSIELLDLALNDSTGKTVKIDFTKTGTSGSPDVYLQYELTNTLISGYSLSSGGERPTESLSLNFTKFEEKWTQYDESNKAANPVTKGYDLALAKHT